MASTCCTSGSRVIITIDGKRWSARSTVTLEWTKTTREVVTNQDGTVAVTIKPMAPTAAFSISLSCGLDLADLENCNMDVTFDLEDSRRVFYFTDATLIGRPALNTETGEISNIKIVAPDCVIKNY